MNKQNRKALADLIHSLELIQTQLDALAQEEREKLDNLPEGLQDSVRAQDMEDAATCLEDQSSAIQDVMDELSNYIG